jgi:hypothetical protein
MTTSSPRGPSSRAADSGPRRPACFGKLVVGGCLLLPVALALLVGCGAGKSVSPVQRDTRLGTVLGIDNSGTSGTYAWLGIPYARPPVGALRWMPPVEPVAWSGIRSAQHFGASSAQVGSLFGPAQDWPATLVLDATASQAQISLEPATSE